MSDNNPPLLIIGNEEFTQRQLSSVFEGFMGYEVHLAANTAKGLAIFLKIKPEVVLLNFCNRSNKGRKPEKIKPLQEILEQAPTTKVIIIADDNNRADAEEAVKIGAFDYFCEPVDLDIVALSVDRAFRLREYEINNSHFDNTQRIISVSGLVTCCPKMQKIHQLVERVSPINVTVTLLGESGTGKERIAQLIHKLSPRHDKKIVAINCASIPKDMLETELFGHEKGAFTGAVNRKIGKIEMADGGTLFLDEIGDLPLDLQAKLLRFMQERVIERLGSVEEISVDTRIICATHQNLNKMISAGTFREDLFYRISELTIELPALKDREGDAQLLAKVFLDRFIRELNLPRLVLTEDALQAIKTHSWPGNIRELENTIKRATILSVKNIITAADLGLAIDTQFTEVDEELNLKKMKEDLERRVLLKAVVETNCNISSVANLLGVSRPTVYKLMEKYNLSLENNFG